MEDKDTQNKQLEETPSDKAPEKKAELQAILNLMTGAEESPEKQQILRALSVFFTSYGGPPPPPFADKVTSEHITMMIEDEQWDRSSVRRWSFTYSMIATAIVVGAILYYTIIDRMDILVPILSAVVSGIAGYGFGTRRRRR